MAGTHVRESEQERLRRYMAVLATFGTTATYGDTVGVFGSAVPTTTANTVVSVVKVKNEPSSRYDVELALEVLRLARSRPAAVFNTPEELMDWLDNA